MSAPPAASQGVSPTGLRPVNPMGRPVDKSPEMRRVTLPLALALSAALCGPALLARAQIYRWEDAQGHLHFSNDPPPAGAKSLGTLDTSEAKARKSEPEAEVAAPEEPAPADELQPQTFRLDDSGLEVTVAVPAGCKRRTSNGGHANVVAIFFDCGRAGEQREGALAIVFNRETRMTRTEVESACRVHSEHLDRVAAALLSSQIAVREASCDPARHKLVVTGSYRSRLELPEAELDIVPTTEGLLAAVALWRSGTHPGTIRALRSASHSASVPGEYLVWPRNDGGVLSELAASQGSDQTAQGAGQRPLAPDLQASISLVFFLLGAAGAFTLYRIVSSEELGARLRGPR
jgi:hypothetical protein